MNFQKVFDTRGSRQWEITRQKKAMDVPFRIQVLTDQFAKNSFYAPGAAYEKGDWRARFETVKNTFSSRIGQICNAALDRSVIAYIL